MVWVTIQILCPFIIIMFGLRSSCLHILDIIMNVYSLYSLDIIPS